MRETDWTRIDRENEAYWDKRWDEGEPREILCDECGEGTMHAYESLVDIALCGRCYQQWKAAWEELDG
jgi:formylmethanofuran dehydrogenase subunit E